MGGQRVMGRQLGGDLRGGLRRDALGLVYRRQFVQLRGRHLPQLSPFPGRAATSRCLADSHRHIFAERHRHRAGHQARQPSGEYGTTRRGGPATPSTMPATDTIPSFAPSTAARSQLSRLDNPALGVRRRGANRGFEPRRPCRPVLRPGRKLRTVGHTRTPNPTPDRPASQLSLTALATSSAARGGTLRFN